MLQVFHSKYQNKETEINTEIKLYTYSSTNGFALRAGIVGKKEKGAAGRITEIPEVVMSAIKVLEEYKAGNWQKGTVLVGSYAFYDPVLDDLASFSVVLKDGVFSIDPLLCTDYNNPTSFVGFEHIITPHKLWEFCEKITSYFS